MWSVSALIEPGAPAFAVLCPVVQSLSGDGKRKEEGNCVQALLKKTMHGRCYEGQTQLA